MKNKQVLNQKSHSARIYARIAIYNSREIFSTGLKISRENLEVFILSHN